MAADCSSLHGDRQALQKAFQAAKNRSLAGKLCYV
jgi:hypothetical protein